MGKQIPFGPSDERCYQSGKLCSKTCYDGKTKCVLWNEFRGRDATGTEVNGWFCSTALQSVLTLEVAAQARQGAAATESFRNEMVRLSQVRVMPGLGAMVRQAAEIENHAAPIELQAIGH